MEKINFQKLKKLLPGLKGNISLKKYTTFRIGGPAKYFFVAKNKEDLIKAIKIAKSLTLPFFIFGEGSNLLVSDAGFNGLVIKIKNKKLKIKNKNKKLKIIEVESGVLLNQVLDLAIKNSLTGLEWAVGIPGTIGGAIRGNAGAFGESIADIIKEVEVFDAKELRIKNYELRDCKFGYRNSIFKKNPYLIIISAVLQLKKGDKKEIEKKIQENLKSRKENQPLNLPSAGSVFKNPSPAQISKKFVAGKGLSAGELIEKCGLKGKRVGGAQISKKHANFIVNLGGGKAEDVIKLIKLIKKEVKKKFRVTLKEEIVILSEAKKNNPALYATSTSDISKKSRKTILKRTNKK
jgi:UDP-N-acetylmuramate dehydrogenase